MPKQVMFSDEGRAALHNVIRRTPNIPGTCGHGVTVRPVGRRHCTAHQDSSHQESEQDCEGMSPGEPQEPKRGQHDLGATVHRR